MYYDENTKKILGEQLVSQDLWDNILRPIIKETDSLYRIAVYSYNLGVINGKRVERQRRKAKI